MTMKSFGNLILMALICIVIFWIFMALRPAQAQFFGPGMNQGAVTNPYGGTYYGGGAATPQRPQSPAAIMKRCQRAGVARECEVYLKRPR